MFLLLIFTVCGAPNMTECRQERLSFNGTLMQCMLFGQQPIAEYVEARNLYLARGYKCEVPGKEEAA